MKPFLIFAALALSGCALHDLFAPDPEPGRTIVIDCKDKADTIIVEDSLGGHPEVTCTLGDPVPVPPKKL